jgi:hypothetical protein
MHNHLLTRGEFLAVSAVKFGLILFCIAGVLANYRMQLRTQELIREHMLCSQIDYTLSGIKPDLQEKDTAQSDTSTSITVAEGR